MVTNLFPGNRPARAAREEHQHFEGLRLQPHRCSVPPQFLSVDV
jgi:hypothetical protein